MVSWTSWIPEDFPVDACPILPLATSGDLISPEYRALDDPPGIPNNPLTRSRNSEERWGSIGTFSRSMGDVRE